MLWLIFGVRCQAQRDTAFEFTGTEMLKKSKAPPMSAHSKFVASGHSRSFSAAC
jgi:hypothetical protein